MIYSRDDFNRPNCASFTTPPLLKIFLRLFYSNVSMKYKILFLVCVLPLLLLTHSFGCVYLEDHLNCDYITSNAYNSYTVLVDTSEFKSVSATLRDQNNNDISLLVKNSTDNINSQITFYQEYMLPYQGVYELSVKGVLLNGVSIINETKSVLYFNATPYVPVIEDIVEKNSSLYIKGFVNNFQEGEKITLRYSSNTNEPMQTQTQELSQENGNSFEFTIPIQEQNLIEVYTTKYGRNSSSYRFVYYNNSQELEFTQLATISQVDVVDENAVLLNPVSSNADIVTKTPYYYISGTTTSGDYVLIQGIPVPVIDNSFQTFLVLNEGEENVCVIGQNEVCNTFNTLYSYSANYVENQNSIMLEDEFDITTAFLNSVEYFQDEIEATKYPVDRNLHSVELVSLKEYEKKYILQDNEPPTIEISSPQNLYSFSEFVVLFSDDVSVDLNSLEVKVDSTVYSYEDSIDKKSWGKIQYARFEVPQISKENVTISAQISDSEGKSSAVEKRVNILALQDSSYDISIEILEGAELFANEIVFTHSQEVRMKIESPSRVNKSENVQTVLNLTSLNSKYISTYSINDEHQIFLTLNLTNIEDGSKLTIPVLVYESGEFSSYEFDFILKKFNSTLEFEDDMVILDSSINSKLVVAKIKNEGIDFSSIKVNGLREGFFITSNYMFIDNSHGLDIEISYSDISGNHKEYVISSNDNSITDIFSFQRVDVSNGVMPYYSLKSSYVTPLEFDIFFSSRNQRGQILQPYYELYFNPLFLEGIFVQSSVFYAKDRYGTIEMNLEEENRESFSSYPTISREDEEFMYRGLLKKTNTDVTLVQGRVLGASDVFLIKAGVGDEVEELSECVVENRFFVCEVPTDTFNNTVSLYAYSNQNTVFAQDTISIVNTKKSPSSEIELDLELNENVYVSSEGFTFSSGDIAITVSPEIEGVHKVYINGEYVKDVDIIDEEDIIVTLTQEEYSKSDENGGYLEVVLEDEYRSQSNSLSLRLMKYLNGIVSIVVS